MALKSKQSKQRREEEATKTMADLTVACETQEALIENLNFGKLIAAEVQRSQMQEYAAISAKKERLQQHINTLKRYENKESFMIEYFNDL